MTKKQYKYGLRSNYLNQFDQFIINNKHVIIIYNKHVIIIYNKLIKLIKKKIILFFIYDIRVRVMLSQKKCVNIFFAHLGDNKLDHNSAWHILKII